MAAARTALLALLLALRAAAGSGAPALPGLDELEEPLDEELLAMESLRSWTKAPFHQVRKGGVIGAVQLASALPGLDELKEPLDEELLAMESLRSWAAAPSYQVMKRGAIDVVQLISAASGGATALDGCGACRGVQGASALPGLDELEEPFDEELLARDSRWSWTKAPFHRLVMLGISLSFLLLFAVALMRQVWTLEERCSSPKADGGASATAVDGRDVRESLNSKDHAPTLLEAPRNAWARGAPGKQGQAKQAVAADTAAGPALSFSAVVPVAVERKAPPSVISARVIDCQARCGRSLTL